MFVGKARSLRKSGTPERSDVALLKNNNTRLRSLAMGKHSSLLRTFVNYSHTLQMFVIR